LDAFAKQKVKQQNRPRGLVSVTDDGRVKIWVKTWSEIISEADARLRFVREKLELTVDKETSLKFLRSTYEKYLTGVVEVDDTPENDPDQDAQFQDGADK
jgi:hypothetical protein